MLVNIEVMKKIKPALEQMKELLLKVKIAGIKRRGEMSRKDTPAPD